MRITTNGMLESMLTELNRNRSKYADLSNQIATARRVNKPSDDAIAFSNGEEKKTVIQRNEQYQSNLASGIELSQVADDTISRMLDEMYQLKTLATKGANGSALTDGDMEILAENVAAVKTKLTELGNTQSNGRYIFAGTRTQTSPFEEQAGGVVYNGNSQNLVVASSQSNTVTIGVNGETLFNYNGESVFDMIGRIETALNNHDAQAVNAELGNIDLSVEYLGRMGGRVGNAINQMQFAIEQFQSVNINLSSQVSRILDTDYAEAATQLQALDTAYQAALSLTSRMSKLSLLNFI
jgi:flagellar hook-associated protein 3 FlgL